MRQTKPWYECLECAYMGIRVKAGTIRVGITIWGAGRMRFRVAVAVTAPVVTVPRIELVCWVRKL